MMLCGILAAAIAARKLGRAKLQIHSHKGVGNLGMQALYEAAQGANAALETPQAPAAGIGGPGVVPAGPKSR